MDLTQSKLTQLPAWKALEKQAQTLPNLDLRQLFAADAQRGQRLAVDALGLYFDYSKHLITDEILKQLISLAEQSQLKAHIEAMFNGEKINLTEARAAFHVALRAPKNQAMMVEGQNVVPEVQEVLDRMSVFANKIRCGDWLGHTGKPIRNIVNIGIGGSDLGPMMAYDALKFYSQRNLNFKFVSNIDGTDFVEATAGFEPEETLFIICSKTFTTIETITNALTARTWLLTKLKDQSAIAKHFVAVSTNSVEVAKFGIDTSNMFGFWDWVGGRFSITSAIGLSLMVAIGPEHFRDMLDGFHQMDEHFRFTPFERNIPVLMALLTIWYNNFFAAQTVAVLPYDSYLREFPTYIQQATMESNGKSTTSDGRGVDYQTSPVYWGEQGTNSQHSFCQFLHQGTKLVPCDFIAFAKSLNPIGVHHQLLIANMLAQTEALAFGKTAEELRAEGVASELIAARTFAGNRPSSILLFEKLTPANLGKLIALYEHNVFVQGVIWQIDSFDQWGVELGKGLAKKIMLDFESNTELQHDSSTNELIKRLKKHNAKKTEPRP